MNCSNMILYKEIYRAAEKKIGLSGIKIIFRRGHALQFEDGCLMLIFPKYYAHDF